MASSKDIRVIAIAAMDEGRVIGLKQGIPWHIPGEQKHFAKLTTGHTVVMGRKTYDSLPEKVRPLPNRKNIVFTRSGRPEYLPTAVDCYSDVADFFQKLRAGEFELPSATVWVIGGEIIYRECLPFCDEICLTLVKGNHEGDAYFPEFEAEFSLKTEEPAETHSFMWFERPRKVAAL